MGVTCVCIDALHMVFRISVEGVDTQAIGNINASCMWCSVTTVSKAVRLTWCAKAYYMAYCIAISKSLQSWIWIGFGFVPKRNLPAHYDKRTHHPCTQLSCLRALRCCCVNLVSWKHTTSAMRHQGHTARQQCHFSCLHLSPVPLPQPVSATSAEHVTSHQAASRDVVSHHLIGGWPAGPPHWCREERSLARWHAGHSRCSWSHGPLASSPRATLSRPGRVRLEDL